MKKKGRNYIPYDYESAIRENIENLHELFIENMLKTRYRCVYACKEIKSGNQLEIEIFPEFTKREDIVKEYKHNKESQNNLNDKNAVKKCQRLINTNFGNGDLWVTLTYEDGQEPQSWDEAYKDIRNYIKRINYRRKKLKLPKVKYLYIAEHDLDASIRWHYHIVMDGMMERELVEAAWKKGKRTQTRKLEEDANGLMGMANYITKDKHRARNEKRWNSSVGLKQPKERKVHSKKKGGTGRYVPVSKYIDTFVRDKGELTKEISSWYPEYDFLESSTYYNDVNGMFYITARLRTYGRGQPRQ